MHYDASTRDYQAHGLRHDPFKALVVPRPIGWIGSISAQGQPNLAPYSYFNAVQDRPPMVMFSSAGRKDSLRNIEATGEFTCSFASDRLRDALNLSSAAVAPGVNEFELAGLAPAPSRFVRPPRVAAAPAALECKLWQVLPLPCQEGQPPHFAVFGQVVGIYINDQFIHEGRLDTGAMRPLARLGYMDYAVVTPEVMFTLNRPQASTDGQTATLQPGSWNGLYR